MMEIEILLTNVILYFHKVNLHDGTLAFDDGNPFKAHRLVQV